MATEAPNTLRSRAKYRVVDMISEGPIVGLAEGLKSVYLNGTPIQANGGELNFKSFNEASDLVRLPKPIYPDSFYRKYIAASNGTISEATETVNTKVTKDAPEGSSTGDGSVVRTITDTDIDAVRVTMRIPALFVQNASTGDSTGLDLRFKISVASNGGPYVPLGSASAWDAWATEETQDNATGLWVKCRLTLNILNRLVAKSVDFQYSRKVGGSWGAWVSFKTISYPAQSPSADQRSYWNNQSYFQSGYRDVEASISNLEPGTYKVRMVTTNLTATLQSKQQFVPAHITITGKCVAPYDVSYVVNLPEGGAPWTIKVERISDDRVASNYQDDLYWLSYTELSYEKFAWPNLAGFELTLAGEDFDSIPERAYDVFGLMISIPSNYDPYNRTYSGVWDGTFQTNWTDNPAWILYDLIKNKRYGLGENIPESYLETLKWSLYSIAQYCDENIVITDDISEPRYTCSCVINSQQEAYDLLNTIVSTFRGMLYPVGEGLMAVADRLTDPVINVGPANVIDGMFVYRGPARRTIHTAAYVTWNNPDDGYKLNTALYENQEGIARYGYKIDKINAVGACSKSLAIRLAKWKILTEVMAPDTVTYRASFDHLNVMPGDIINVSDPAYTSEELIGRILSITDNEDSTHTVELDRSVARIGGDESILQLTLPDQTILSIDVSVISTTTSTEIIVPSAELTTMPVTGAMWLLSKETVRPRMWRVFNIEEAEKNIYEVSASLVDPEKWDEIEGTHNFEPADYTAFPSGELPAPTGLTHSEFLKQSGNSIVCCVNISWTAPDDARAAFYRAEYRKGSEPWKSTEPVLCQNPSIDVFDIEPGTYDFRVQAQDGTGLMKSDWTYRTSQTLYGKQKAPENVTGFSGTVEKFGILLKWTPVSDIDIDFYEVRTGATWAGSAATAKKTKASELKIEDATTGTYQFWIAAKDTTGNYSATPVTTSVTVSAQSIPTVTATSVTSGIQIDIGGSVTRGFKAYEIQRRAYPAGTATTINNNVLTTKFNDSDIATLGYTTQWQYRVRALDQNGDASGWSDWSTQKTAKQVEGVDITANQIIAKDFRTCCNAGNGTVSGVLFNANGIQAWNGATNTFCINAATGDVSMTGTITANNGLIGGWCIKTGCLCATNAALYSGAANTARVEMGVGACSAGINSANAGTDISFWAGSTFANRASAPFNVTAAGALTANNGLIGGWCIKTGCLCATNAALYSGAANTARVEMGVGACSAGINSANAGTDISFWAGSTFANRASAPFNVTAAGALTANSGKIANWFISQTRLLRLFTNGCLVLGMGQGEQIQWAENTDGAWSAITIGQCVWTGTYVARTGMAITFNNTPYFQVHKPIGGGDICANIAGWNFNATQIYSTGCGLILCNTGAIQTGLFQAGNQGWKIDSVGNAEFNNICARGAIRTAVFIKDQISVIGGCTMIRPASVLSADDTYSASSNIYYVDDNTQFAVNDLIRIKSDAGDFWGKVTASATGCITVDYCNGNTSGNITKGQAIVNYGSCLGCGGIMLNGQCPYIDLYTHAGLPWSALCSRVRIGNLKNWSANFACDTYGIAMGSALGQYMTYDSESGVLDIAGNINVKSTLPLVMPAGAVGEWSVRGATTASIQLTGGIVNVAGNGLNGTASTQASITDIIGMGKAILFNGTGSSYATIPHGAPIDFERTDKFSISIVARRDGNPGSVSKIFTKGSGFSTAGYGIVDYFTENQLRFYLSAGATYLVRDLDYPTGYTSGTPIMITMTYDGTTSYAGLKIYINGEQASPYNVANTLTTSIKTTNQLIFGDYFNGAITQPKIFNRELTAEEVKTLYLLGKDTESGTITAERIKTGVMSSLNWGTSAGSCFNMNDGTFTLGGSSAPKLSWNGTTLNVVGNITIAAGSSGIANFTDANIDNIADGSTYKRTTTNEKTGAGYGFNGLVTNGTVYGIARPDTRSTNQLPSWYSRGVFNEFKSSTALGITGANTYGNLTTDKPWTDASGGIVVQTYRDGSGVWERRSSADHASWGSWYKLTDNTGSLVSRVIPGTAVTPTSAGLFLGSNNMGYHNGTEWRTYMDSNGNFYLGGTGANKGMAWNATDNCLTVCGCITSCAGTIGGWNLSAGCLQKTNTGSGEIVVSAICSSFYMYRSSTNIGEWVGQIYNNSAWTGRYGLAVTRGANTYIFRADTDINGTNACAQIAGWNFNAACLYSGYLILNSSGAISGCYSGDTTGWCIDAAGNAKFNNATVRGVICACGGGNIGGFTIGTSMLCSTPAAGCSVGMSACTTSGAVAFWAGCSTVASAPFRVTNTGEITALCGQIGCFTLTGGCLFATVAAQDCAAIRMTQGYYCNSLGPGYGAVARDVPSTCRDTLWSTPSSLIMASWSCVTAQYRCSCITMCSTCNGNVPASAPIMVCMFGGALCYAMCVSGSIYATGGTVCTSDRNLKTDFQDVNVLHLLRQMPVTKWRFKDGKDYKIGPMAQDFNNLFRLNHDWRTNLTVSGLDGIALKAVKEVDENVQKHDRDIAGLKAKIAALESSLAELKEAIAVH